MPPTPTPDTRPDSAVATWTSFWTAVSAPEGADDELARALDFGTQEAVDEVRSFPWGTRRRQVHNHPTPIEQPDGTVIIDDCILHDPHFNGPIWWRGTIEPSDDGTWIVTTVDMLTLFGEGCVPAEINHAALTGYAQYLSSFLEVFESPDPTSPLLEETMTGNHLEAIRSGLAAADEEGWTVRGGSTNHPEVTRMTDEDRLVILDCYSPSPDYGAYDETTGERLDDLIAPITDGERDLAQVEMRKVDGTWKVEGINALLNVDCEFAPTEHGVLVV